MNSSNRMIVSLLAVAALAIAFWVLALAPKRQQADDLSGQIAQLRSSLAESQSEIAAAAVARRQFPANYQQLVVLGKAVPNSDDTSSLLVELNKVAHRSDVQFDSIKLSAASDSSSTAATTTPTPAIPPSGTVPPTEAAAALLPLGATVGAAGLGVMPYDLTFSGDFFHVADFIKGIDSLVDTKRSHVAVDGRLMTLDGFALTGDSERGFPHLKVTFLVTTYLTPPSQGITAGATPAGPGSSSVTANPTTTTPDSTTTASTTPPAAR